MATKRLYKCDECGSRRFVTPIELSRRAKPKCYRCGATRLEMVSDDAREEMQDVSSAMYEQKSQVKKKGNR